MALSFNLKKISDKKGWWFGGGIGVVLTIMMVLASGFMINTTNTDTFCVSCHIMTPFRTHGRIQFTAARIPRALLPNALIVICPTVIFSNFSRLKPLPVPMTLFTTFISIPLLTTGPLLLKRTG